MPSVTSVSAETAQALLAGWLSGAAAGLAITAVVLIVLARHPEAAARLPGQGRLRFVAIVVANALVLGLTLVGLVLGALYLRTSGDAGGAWFSLVVAGGCVAAAALYVFVRGQIRGGEAPVVLGSIVIAAAAFGVMLPLLAGLET